MKPQQCEIREIFSIAVKHVIKSKGLKQNAIAANLNMSTSSMGDYVNGRREGDETTRRKIAEGIGLEYEDILSLGAWILDKGTAEGWGSLAQHGVSVYGNGNVARSVQAGRDVVQPGRDQRENNLTRNSSTGRPADHQTHLKLIVEWINERSEADPTHGLIFFEQLKNNNPDFKDWLEHRLQQKKL